jgi:stearoyl-CoA desaturase (Delta-9 desaturase)
MLYQVLLTLAIAFVLIQVAVFGTTIYLHRSATHRAIELHPTVAWVFRFSLWLTTGLSTKEWTAIHRKHHAFTDKEGDPHSPKLKGFWSVQLGNVVHYVKEGRGLKRTGEIERYSQGVEEDWWDRTLFSKGLLGVVVGIAMLIVILGVGWGLLAALIHGIVYVFVLSSSINGLCHTVGYKNFDNTATNIGIVAWFTGGEGYHNNHHEYPRSPKFSWRAGEIDPAWPIIKLLVLLRLAKPAKTIEEMVNAE